MTIKKKEIPELETNALKEALVITPEVIQNLEISLSKIKSNSSSEVKDHTPSECLCLKVRRWDAETQRTLAL